MIAAFDNGGEVVACELARLAREAGLAVREEDLRLADAARVDQELTWPGIARRVLEPDPEIEVAERDPGSLTRPARLDQLRVEREQPAEGGDRLRRSLLLEARGQLERPRR